MTSQEQAARSDAAEVTRRSEVTQSTTFWDAEVVDPHYISWMQPETVRRYVNELISGPDALWPIDWFWQQVGQVKFGRALSIGCGSGALERDLMKKEICGTIDAFDGSVTSVHVARKLAKSEGMSDRIRYYVADFDQPSLPARTYDIVFFHQSLHHVAKLERLLRQVLAALRPNGLLYLDEYVGPSRHDWNDQIIATARSVYDALPAEVRQFDVLPLPVQPHDPSEAIRSSEILRQVAIGFELVQNRGYGGNILSLVYPVLKPEKTDEPLLKQLIDIERANLTPATSHYHAVVIARPKTGWRRAAALVQYVVEPKVRRLRYEIARLFGVTVRY